MSRIVFVTFLIAIAQSAAASNSRNPLDGKLCPNAFSDVKSISVYASDLRKASIGYAIALRQVLEPVRLDYRDDPEVNLSTDPLVCRICVGASMELIEYLRRDFPKGRWRLVRTKNVRSPLFSWLVHVFIYAENLDLIVDPTYRQGLVGIRGFETLPPIFVGSRVEFRNVFEPHLNSQALLDLSTFTPLGQPIL